MPECSSDECPHVSKRPDETEQDHDGDAADNHRNYKPLVEGAAAQRPSRSPRSHLAVAYTAGMAPHKKAIHHSCLTQLSVAALAEMEKM